jgi:hypothetical protein
LQHGLTVPWCAFAPNLGSLSREREVRQIDHRHMMTELFRDLGEDLTRQEVLRKRVFSVAIPGAVEFDDLLDKVLSISSEVWVADRQAEEANT